MKLRIIVFSDTHGSRRAMDRIFADNTDADVFIFLGDGDREFDDVASSFPEKKTFSVRGNCDVFSTKQTLGITTVAGKKILFVHGNLHNVKYSTQTIKSLAHDYEADVVLFGHTHQRFYEYDDGLFVLNPGSASRPRDGKAPSYAFVDITKAGIVCNHIDL